MRANAGFLIEFYTAITFAAQDAFAFQSHHRAAAAWASGRFDGEVMHVPVPPRFERVSARDNVVRKDTTLEALAQLRPVFDRRYGTITAGNASPLTDGAAALLLMSEERARALGLQPLGYIKSYAYAALDPHDQLLQGPAYAAPVALDRAGLTLADMDLVDMHEAFAAQVLSNLKAFASKAFAEKELGRAQPLGEVDPARLNVNGGSIALGHPFAATGARMILQTLRELDRRRHRAMDVRGLLRDNRRVLIYTNSRRAWRTNAYGDYWVLDRTAGTLKKIGGDVPDASLMYAAFSPDGTKIAYVRQKEALGLGHAPKSRGKRWNRCACSMRWNGRGRISRWTRGSSCARAAPCRC